MRHRLLAAAGTVIRCACGGPLRYMERNKPCIITPPNMRSEWQQHVLIAVECLGMCRCLGLCSLRLRPALAD